MKIRTLLAATAAVSMAASPAIAQADRSIAPVTGQNALGGDDGDGSGVGIILALLAAAAIIAGIVIAADNDDDDAPGDGGGPLPPPPPVSP
ncbi:MAG: hypothetical protein WA948_02105 [Pontixanthobacter sp.]